MEAQAEIERRHQSNEAHEKRLGTSVAQPRDVVRDAPYYEAALLARLVHRMNVLGHATEQHKDSFKLVGIAKSTVAGRPKATAAAPAAAKSAGMSAAKRKSNPSG